MIILSGMEWFTSSGYYSNTYSSSNNCDSTHTLNLTINNSTSGVSLVSACDSFIWNGSLYTSSGLYTFNYLNYNGCDSIHTLDLRINICGCTDSLAYNYNPNANSDDGSCVDIVLGCIDSSSSLTMIL